MGFEPPTPQEVETQKPVIDIDSIKVRVPPIEGVFYTSKEVQQLRTVPRKQRKEAITSFKDKLARQREAWALCRISVEELINSNPDLPREEIVGVIGNFASQYGFSPDHVKVAYSLVDDYLEMRRRAVYTREKYPNDIDLINHLTGLKFTESDKDDFKVALGPMSIEISCSSSNAGRIFYKSKDPVVGFKAGGFATKSKDPKPVYYIIINNDIASTNPVFHSSVIPHEREHLKNFLLEPRLYDTNELRDDARKQLNRGVRLFLRHQIDEKVLQFGKDFEKEVFQEYSSNKDPIIKAFLLSEYMRLKRETALKRVKNEIFSMKSEPNYERDQYNIFMKLDGGPKDYLRYIREWDKKKGDLLWQNTAQRVLVDEYRKIIDDAIFAFGLLEAMGYSRAEVIAMLTDKRLAEWPKTVKRLLETKKK